MIDRRRRPAAVVVVDRRLPGALEGSGFRRRDHRPARPRSSRSPTTASVVPTRADEFRNGGAGPGHHRLRWCRPFDRKQSGDVGRPAMGAARSAGPASPGAIGYGRRGVHPVRRRRRPAAPRAPIAGRPWALEAAGNSRCNGPAPLVDGCVSPGAGGGAAAVNNVRRVAGPDPHRPRSVHTCRHRSPRVLPTPPLLPQPRPQPPKPLLIMAFSPPKTDMQL